MTMNFTAAQLKAAGFSQESIIEHIENQRENYKKVGFSDYQINNFFGIEKQSSVTDSLLKNTGVGGNPDEEYKNPLEKKVIEGNEVDTSETIPVEVTEENEVNEQTNQVNEQTNIRPIIDTPEQIAYNIDQYKSFKDEAQKIEAEKFAEDIMMSKGKIYFDNLTDAQKQEYSKNAGNLSIDGKPVEVIINKNRLTKKEEDRTKFPVLDENATSREYTAHVLNSLQTNYGLNLNEINTLNFNQSVISGIVSNNKNIRNKDDTAGGLFQIKNDEMVGLLNILENIVRSTDPDFKRPSWWNKALGHRKADVLPDDVQRSLSLIKFTKNVDANDLIVSAAQGNTEALETLLFEYYDPSLKENPEKFIKVKEYYSAWPTFDYDYVGAGLPIFRSDSALTKSIKDQEVTELFGTKLPEKYQGKDLIFRMGGEGAYSVYSNNYKMSVMGLFDEFQKLQDQYGFTSKEALRNSFMYQTQSFPEDLIAMASQIVGDTPAIAAGASFGFVGGSGVASPVMAITGGFTLPEVIRSVFIRSILNDEIDSFEDFMDELISVQTAKDTAKYAAVGAATGYAGIITRRKYGNLAGIGVETGTLVGVLSALEGQVPNRKDFLNAAVMIFGIHGASRGVNKLYSIYNKYGIPPQNLKKSADEDPEVLADLLNPDQEAPQTLIDMNKIFETELAKKSGDNKIIIDPPKNNINAEVKIESGTDGGKIQSRAETDFGEVVVEIKKDTKDSASQKKAEILFNFKTISQKQSISSAGTDVNFKRGAIPALYNKIDRTIGWKENTTSLEIGSGAGNVSDNFLKSKKVSNIKYDPYRLTEQQNESAVTKLKELKNSDGGVDTVVIANVLNVIPEESVRITVLQQAKYAIKDGGKVYIDSYNAGKKGETSSGFQLGRPNSEYIPEIESVFGKGSAKIKGGYIEVTPKIKDETFIIPEENTYMAMPKNDLQVDIVDGKINIGQKVDNDFQIKQKDKEFNNDLVETRKDPLFLRKNLNDIEAEITNYTKNDYVVTSNETIGTSKYFVNKQAYPELAKEINKYLGGTKKKEKNTKEILNKYFQKLNLSKMSKIDEVLGVRKNGSSGSRYNKIILRTNKGEFVEVPAQIYTNLKEFNYKQDNIDAKSTPTFAYDKNLLIAYDEITKKVIAVLQAKKVDPKLNTQSNIYYERYIKREDKVFPDSNYNNADFSDKRKMPDEPESIFSEDQPEYRRAETYQRFFNNAKGLEVYDLVQLLKQLTSKTPLLKNIIRTPDGGEAFGVFSFLDTNKNRSDKKLEIRIKRALQEDPEKFTMTLAHEIGHLLDSLPEGVLKDSDGLLSRLSGLKGYMNEWIGAKADGASPLSDKEILRIRKQAEADAQKDYEKNKKDLKEETGITPDDIKGIINDPDFRAKLNPDFYDEFLDLSEALRTQILKSAFKGIIDPYIKPLINKYTGAKINHTAEIMAKAETIFAKKVEAEIRNRGLVNRTEIRKELISLSEKWKPYDKTVDMKHTRYRQSSPELMADFMMAILTRPRWTLLNAPKSTQLFYNHMYTRPNVRLAYEKAQNVLHAPKDSKYGQMYLDIADMFSDGNQRLLKAKQNAWIENKSDADIFMINFVDTAGWFLNRKSGDHKLNVLDNTKQNRWKDEATIQVDAKLKSYQYRPVVLETYINQMGKIFAKMERQGSGGMEQLGVALLLRNLANSTQRSKLANPTGMWAMLDRDDTGKIFAAKHQDKLRNPKEAYEILIKENPLLDELVNDFYAVRKEFVIPLFRESKAFSKSQLDQLENNLEYVTYNVTNAAINTMQNSGGTKSITAAFMKPAIGTLSDILNPFQSTIEKDLLIIGELKRNALIHDMTQWMIQNKSWLEKFGAKEMRSLVPNWKDRVVQKATKVRGIVTNAPNGMETIAFLSNGKYQHYYINKQAAKAFKRNPESYVEGIKWLATANAAFRGIFTQYNPVFWNKEIVKDARATVTNLPKATFFFGKNTRYVPTLIKSLKPAWSSVFGKGDDVTRMFDRDGYWLPITDGYRANAGRKHLKYRYENDEIAGDLYFQEQLERKMNPRKRNELYNKTFGPLYDFIGKVAIFYDRANKLGGYTQAKRMIDNGTIPKMSKEELYLRTVSDYGSPPFGLHGQYHPVMNNLILFSNASVQGWRRDLAVLKGDPIDILGKHMKYQIAPKMLEYLAKVGVFGVGYGSLSHMYGGVREYDKLNYHNIPLGYTSTGRVYYMRIPMDESARFFAGLFYTTADALFTDGEPMDILRKGIESTVPSESPAIRILSQAYKFYIGGENPIDPFSGTSIIDRDIFESDLELKKTKEFMKYQFNNNIGTVAGYKFKSDSLEELESELEEILGYPIIGRQIANYLMVGNNPDEVMARQSVREQRVEDATDRVIYKDALNKLVDPFNNEPFKPREIEMIIKNQKYIKHNDVVKRALSRAMGGNDFVEYFLTGTRKEQIAILVRTLEPDMSVHGENSTNLFKDIIGLIKNEPQVENILQNVIE